MNVSVQCNVADIERRWLRLFRFDANFLSPPIFCLEGSLRLFEGRVPEGLKDPDFSSHEIAPSIGHLEHIDPKRFEFRLVDGV
ncbi:hypothetical protein ACFU51_37670 [Streptomyces sp. NPDC057430]|uniref:hypothetical protein n=1 Tax=Streptomyces sp. NPDC057430 TaxID=3346131 RepID=UPI0036C3E28A